MPLKTKVHSNVVLFSVSEFLCFILYQNLKIDYILELEYKYIVTVDNIKILMYINSYIVVYL